MNKYPRTGWWCERCHASGVIETDERDSLLDQTRLIRSNHDNAPLAFEAGCGFDPYRTRTQLLLKEFATPASTAARS